MQNLYEILLGNKNSGYYQKRFELFDQKDSGLKANWNWASFFLGGIWALYRKMYSWFFILLLAGIIANVVDSYSVTISTVIIIIAWLVFPIFANSLYQSSLNRKIERAKLKYESESQVIDFLQRQAGVNKWVIWVVAIPVFGIIASLLLPMFITK